MEEGLYQPIFVYSVHLESGELVQKYSSLILPPKAGEKLILDIDNAYTRFTVIDVSKDVYQGFEFFVLKVSKDEIVV